MSRRICRKQDTKSAEILYELEVIRLVDPVGAAAFDGRGRLSPACPGQSAAGDSAPLKCPARQPVEGNRPGAPRRSSQHG